MSTILKQNEILTSIPDTAGARPAATSGAGPSGDGGARRQPVALEIPVTVNGARAVAGSDKREQFSESTKTVLIFGHGAVVRLASSVAPGQLIFLTNDKTQKEVVCQVVSSKNQNHTSGYVELEFTEAVAGFWGMRFATERGTSQPQAAPSPAASSPASSPLNSSATLHANTSTNLSANSSATKIPPPSSRSEFKPVVPVASAKQTVSLSDDSSGSATSLSQANSSSTASTSPAGADSTAQTTTASKPKAISSATELSEFLAAETIKAKHSDESLSSAKEKSTIIADAGKSRNTADFSNSANIADVSKTTTLPVIEAPAASRLSATAFTSLDSEEVKIPSWLEPLARNAAAASAALPEIVSPEKEAKEANEDEEFFEGQDLAVTETAAVPERKVVELPAPAYGKFMLADENDLATTSDTSNKANKQIFIIAIAAAVLMFVSVVVWYANQSSGQASTTAANHSASSNTVSSNSPAKSAPSATSTQGHSNASGNFTSVSSPVSTSGTTGRSAANASSNAAVTTAGNAPDIANTDLKVDNNVAASDVAPKTLSARAKKSAAIRPLAPVVNRNKSGDTHLEDELNLTAASAPAPSEGLASGLLVSNSKQPAAPAAALPVGGVVRTAKLTSSVQPAYPPLAKMQRIGGDVKIDALVDANGQVTATKVISGPALLQQAAMEALRKWKYEPALLDGKPVPMHLTVTLQFRLQ